jgi:hypothetical protein
MESSKQGFSVGWVFVSYFMIAGGIILGLSLAALTKTQSEVLVYAMYFIGAAFGGFFAGRASPGKTILEPAAAGFLLVLSYIGLLMLVPGVREVLSMAGEKVFVRAILAGGLTGAGGMVGAALGERTQPPTSDSSMRWIGLSSLITLGVFFFLFMLLAILMLRQAAEGGSLTENEGITVVFLSLAGAAFLGGLITQSIAPRRMCFACGSGFVVVIMSMVALAAAASDKGMEGNAVTGMVIIGIGGLLVGALGALVGWAMFGKRRVEAAPTDVARTFE